MNHLDRVKPIRCEPPGAATGRPGAQEMPQP